MLTREEHRPVLVSHASELETFLGRVKSYPQLFSVTLPVGNGEELSFKL